MPIFYFGQWDFLQSQHQHDLFLLIVLTLLRILGVMDLASGALSAPAKTYIINASQEISKILSKHMQQHV